MAQTKEGAAKAKQTMLKKYGENYFKEIGSIGGKLGHTGGFYANPELAVIAGRKGGKISRRGVKLHNAPKDSKVTTELGEKYEENTQGIGRKNWITDTALRLGHVLPTRRKAKPTSTRSWR